MADDIIVGINEKGVDKFIQRIIEAGKAVDKVDKSVEGLNDSLDDTGKESKSLAALTKQVTLLEKELAKAKNQGKTAFDSTKVKNLQTEIKKTKDEVGRTSSGVGGLGKALGAAFTATAVIAFTKHLFKLGTEIDATGRKVEIVFGSAAKDINDFAEKTATSLGLTVTQYKAAAAAAGDLLIPMQFNRQEAADMSNQLISLSGALAAWTGGQYDARQVSEILTKALLGEREQLKALGISIQEADIQTRLLEKGQKGLTGTALQQAKALATLELITEKTTDAQTAFGDSTKTLAEQRLELNARMQQFTENLAKGLIPAFNDLLSVGGFVLDVFERMKTQIIELLKLNDAEIEDIIEYNAELEEKTRLELEGARYGLEAAKSRKEINEEEVKAFEEVVRMKEEELEYILMLKQKRDDLLKSEQANNNERKKIAKDAQNSINAITKAIQAQNEIIKSADPLSKTFEDANYEVKRLEKELSKIKDLLDEITKLGEEFDIDKSGLEEQFKYRADKLKEENALREDLINRHGDLQSEASEKLRERLEKNKEERIQLEKETQDAIRELSYQALESGFDIFNSIQERKLQSLEEQNKKGLLSDEQLAREKAKILRKQAIADKAQAVFNIGMNTYEAVMASLAITPLPLGAPLVALNAAMGAAQLAAVIAQPIPQFKKGVKDFDGGLAVVGDGGKREPITDKDGKLIGVSPNKSTLVNLPKGANVFSSEDSFIGEMLKNNVPIQYNYSMMHDELQMPNPSIESIIKDKVKSEVIKGSLGGINLNPLLSSSDMNRLTLGKKLDKQEKLLQVIAHNTTQGIQDNGRI